MYLVTIIKSYSQYNFPFLYFYSFQQILYFHMHLTIFTIYFALLKSPSIKNNSNQTQHFPITTTIITHHSKYSNFPFSLINIHNNYLFHIIFTITIKKKIIKKLKFLMNVSISISIPFSLILSYFFYYHKIQTQESKFNHFWLLLTKKLLHQGH